MTEEKNARAIDVDYRLGGISKKTILIIAAIAVVALVVAAFIFMGVNTDKVDDETAQNVLEQSDIVKNGLVPQDYTNESSYKVAKFRISDQKDTGGNANRSSISRLVTYEATIENDSFSSDIVGTMELSKVGDRWIAVEEPLALNLLEGETRPLKGVDRIEHLQDSSSQNDNVEYSDFKSTLSDNGNYSSVATEKVSYNYWFAIDTATRSRTFKFDQDRGWVPSDGIEVSDEKTKWNLAGRSFLYDDAGSSSNVSVFKMSLVLGDVDDEGFLSANHDISLKAESAWDGQLDVDGRGAASGEISHDFGKSSFEVTLKDSSSNITYWLEGYSKAKVNLDCTVGQGNEQYYQVSLKESESEK